ncbi:MAG: class II aldolase/adducin family protein [Acidaminobacteraceae bacterium]
MLEINLKQDLLRVSKEMHTLGLVASTSGNVSVYNKELGIMIITPSSVSYVEMEIEDLVVLKLDGEIVSGDRKPSSEWKMHAKIYMERSEVGSVVHTHSPYATGFAVCHIEIPVILIEMIPFIGGSALVADFAMPGSEELGMEVLKVLKERSACLLSNHGALSIGKDAASALNASIYLEDAAKIYHIAKTVGQVKVLPDEIIAKMKA